VISGSIARDRVAVVSEIARDHGAGGALLSQPATLRWIGVTAPEDVHVLVAAGEAMAVAAADARPPHGIPVELYAGSEARAAADALSRALVRADLNGTDPVVLDAPKPEAMLTPALRGRRRPDASAALAAARARKAIDELVLIGDAAHLLAIGHRAVRETLAPGLSERELWRSAQAAMRRAADAPVDAAVDLMAGARTALIGEPPGPARVASGDPVLFDLAPQRYGYWADSCATFACVAPPFTLRRRHDVVRSALEAGMSAARPGTTAGEVDARMRAVLDRAGLECPHHTGHGVGTAPQEPPWLNPGEGAVLEEGMVLALEPGAYSDGFGVRLEHLVLVEPGGARPLTRHSLDLT
jgi:Xaa-Pro aminopeptidase